MYKVTVSSSLLYHLKHPSRITGWENSQTNTPSPDPLPLSPLPRGFVVCCQDPNEWVGFCSKLCRHQQSFPPFLNAGNN